MSDTLIVVIIHMYKSAPGQCTTKVFLWKASWNQNHTTYALAHSSLFMVARLCPYFYLCSHLLVLPTQSCLMCPNNHVAISAGTNKATNLIILTWLLLYSFIVTCKDRNWCFTLIIREDSFGRCLLVFSSLLYMQWVISYKYTITNYTKQIKLSQGGCSLYR